MEEQQDVDLFAGLEASTFRDRFVVTLEDNSKMRQTEQDIRAIEGVADVTAHYEIAEGFQTVQQILNIASIIIIAVLLVVSMLIISNTVKLAMYDRKDEIAIMKMVGATNGFIRWPFVVEGFILGIVASALAFFLEWGLYNLLETQVAAWTPSTSSPSYPLLRSWRLWPSDTPWWALSSVSSEAFCPSGDSSRCNTFFKWIGAYLHDEIVQTPR